MRHRSTSGLSTEHSNHVISDHRSGLESVARIASVGEDLLIGQTAEPGLFQRFARPHLENVGW